MSTGERALLRSAVALILGAVFGAIIIVLLLVAGEPWTWVAVLTLAAVVALFGHLFTGWDR